MGFTGKKQWLVVILMFLLCGASPLLYGGDDDAADSLAAPPFAILELMGTDLTYLGDALKLDDDQLGALKYMLAVDTEHLQRELRAQRAADTAAALALYRLHRQVQLAFENESKEAAPDFAALGERLRQSYRGRNPNSQAVMIEAKVVFFGSLSAGQRQALAAFLAAQNR
ncbi:MAG: hypothetical protein GX444_20300 [Myxococcales bacterium]|nr:hypothetical protein [Myxococcales bacterium]